LITPDESGVKLTKVTKVPSASFKETAFMKELHSYDVAFSKIGIDSSPQRICNYRNGEIDTSAFEHWKMDDISRYLLTNWNSLTSDLDGKVRPARKYQKSRTSSDKQLSFLFNKMLLEAYYSQFFH